MGFIDSATQKVTSAALTVKDKGGEVVDKVKLNARLSKEQKKLKNIYFEIGKEYVESHADEADEKMQEYLYLVEESKKKIEELEGALNEVW